ncbi:MAG: Bro-N domain-containing protein [Ruminococcus sp.]|nr:Bro-N domain-containing protein [Ruminococcus sp.]
MNEIQIFKNEEFGEIRTLEIDGQIYFVGVDVAKALGYIKTRNAIRDHVDEDDKKVFNLNTALKQGGIISAGNPNVILINESGLYSLILSSKLESARKFKHWVTAEVLPAIRRTGTYGISHGISDIEEIVNRMLDEKIETVINKVFDEKMEDIIKTVKETVEKNSYEIVNTLIPCFLYTHQKLKKLYKKLKDK